MPPGKTNDGAKGNARIRFVMLEADIVDGNLADIAQAITSALRPPTIMARAIPMTTPAARKGEGEEVIDSVDSGGVVPPAEAGAEADLQTSPPRAKTPRKFYSPKVLIDVDLNWGGLSFEQFAREKKPTETSKRYLTIAAWFKQSCGLDSITVDHVYTCYRKMGWGTDIKDMVQPFRDLKAQGWGDAKRRTFTINHIGLDVVDKLGRE
jgi:hypothetical protein